MAPNPFIERPLIDRLLASPLTFFLHPLYILLLRLRGAPHRPSSHPIRVVCLSDTHTLEWHDVPDGDLLIHAGDLCNDGSAREIQGAIDWINSLPHAHKVVIAGNHDSYFDARSRRDEDRVDSLAEVSKSTGSITSVDDDGNDARRLDWGGIHYLQHSSVTLSFGGAPEDDDDDDDDDGEGSPHRPVRKLNIYGAPQIPTPIPMGPEHAFTYAAGSDAWSGTIPRETDVLITHTPPLAHRDLGPNFPVGCPHLLAEVWRVRPRLHVFGHVHAAAGVEPIFWDEAQRAWERLCARPRRTRLGWMCDAFSPTSWIDTLRVIAYGITGILWARVWGGELSRGSGWMVNAACMYRNSGTLNNPPRVFDL
jgi:hypothetical protein